MYIGKATNHCGFHNAYCLPIHRKPPCMMPLRSYSTWTWWFRSPSGCTHQHHGKTHHFQFHALLGCGLFAVILGVSSEIHLPGNHFFFLAAIFVFCCWSGVCIKFSNPCIEPHELLKRPLKSTESPFLRGWQFTCPSTSSTTILDSGQNQRNLTQKGSVFLHPPSL